MTAATIKLYDPFAGTESTFYSVPAGDASASLLLLNILIELRVMNQYLGAQSTITDEVESLRADVMTEGAS